MTTVGGGIITSHLIEPLMTKHQLPLYCFIGKLYSRTESCYQMSFLASLRKMRKAFSMKLSLSLSGLLWD